MFALSLFGTVSGLEVRTFGQMPCRLADEWISLNSGEIRLSESGSVVFVTRRQTEVGVLTWVGLYRSAIEMSTDRAGGYFGAGVWLLGKSGPSGVIIRLLESLSGQVATLALSGHKFVRRVSEVESSIHWHEELGREIRQGLVDLHPDTGLGVGDLAKCFLDLSEALPGQEISTFVEEMQVGLAVSNFRGVYIAADGAVCESVRRMGRLTVFTPARLQQEQKAREVQILESLEALRHQLATTNEALLSQEAIRGKLEVRIRELESEKNRLGDELQQAGIVLAQHNAERQRDFSINEELKRKLKETERVRDELERAVEIMRARTDTAERAARKAGEEAQKATQRFEQTDRQLRVMGDRVAAELHRFEVADRSRHSVELQCKELSHKLQSATAENRQLRAELDRGLCGSVDGRFSHETAAAPALLPPPSDATALHFEARRCATPGAAGHSGENLSTKSVTSRADHAPANEQVHMDQGNREPYAGWRVSLTGVTTAALISVILVSVSLTAMMRRGWWQRAPATQQAGSEEASHKQPAQNQASPATEENLACESGWRSDGQPRLPVSSRPQSSRNSATGKQLEQLWDLACRDRRSESCRNQDLHRMTNEVISEQGAIRYSVPYETASANLDVQVPADCDLDLAFDGMHTEHRPPIPLAPSVPLSDAFAPSLNQASTGHDRKIKQATDGNTEHRKGRQIKESRSRAADEGP